MRILGISAFYHDSAAALLVDDQIVAAAQEERFTRIKHDAGFPAQAIAFCLARGGLDLDDVDHIVFYDKPLLKFERLLETYLSFAPRGFRSFAKAMPVWLREKLFLKSLLESSLRPLASERPGRSQPTGTERVNRPRPIGERLLFCEHHLSHAASAFYPSPFDEALVLTLDGVGEWATTSLAHGRGQSLQILKEIHFPHSLGLLYSAFTYYTGFKVNSGEYKLMGLAPYGEPRHAQTILDHLIDLKPDGSFRLDMQYFDYCTGLRMTSERFHRLFGGPPLPAGQTPGQREMDLAASVQAVIEEAVCRLVRAAVAETGIDSVCLAGGVALNCVANGKLARDGAARRLWIQPAAGDAGGALGAALAARHLQLGQPRSTPAGDAMQGARLGPEFDQADIEARLTAAGAVFTVLDDATLYAQCAAGLADEKALGWFQGRMEFGPRALGARSILADPRSPRMQSTLNLKVKFRESFRPFAPAVLREHVADWFELDGDSPYMLLVAEVARHRRIATDETTAPLTGLDRLRLPRSQIPAVTHVDHSARIQTVDADIHPRFHRLISAFHARTGCPVVVNTSFNVRGEPVVCTPEQAFACFMGTDIELLAVGNCLLRKEDQPVGLARDHRGAFAPD
ncbi:MAG: carbamoyltransferase [Burkholderiaceae bacterium]